MNKPFFSFNKQKTILAVLLFILLSAISRAISASNPEYNAFPILTALLMPVEYIYTLVFAVVMRFLPGSDSIVFRVLHSIVSTTIILSLKVLYFYTLACVVYYFKNEKSGKKVVSD